MNLRRNVAEVLNIVWQTNKHHQYCCQTCISQSSSSAVTRRGRRVLAPSSFRYFSCTSTMTASNMTVSATVVDQTVLDRVENEWKLLLGQVKYHGNAIFVLGPMGAGKTTTIEKSFKSHPRFKHYAYVDTDAIMGSIDAFSAEKVDEYYPLARKIAIRLTDWILTQRISFVAEGTCVKVDELIEYMTRLQQNGYKLYVNRLPIVALDEILRRSKHRKNRIIADEVVADIYKKSSVGLKELYNYNKRVQYSLFEDISQITQSRM